LSGGGIRLIPIKNEDVVKVVVVDPSLIVPGDIIVYKQFETHITIHRVIHRHQEQLASGNKYTFKTKGDNNDYIDTYEIHPAQILGKVIKKI